jgi:hypothetical protein
MTHANHSYRQQAAIQVAFAFSMALLVVTVPPAGGQWLDHRTPGIPRTADGKLDADAPAPRTAHGTPDLSGLWRQPVPPGYVIDIAADLPAEAVAPIASRLYELRLGEFGKDDPATIGCLPSGPRHIIGGSTADIVRIVQTPTLIVMVFESLASRQIHLDGRSLPKDPNPSFMGYSVGRWEGDTLVVETIGFNGRTWLDFGGHPHGDRLKTVERFRRTTFGRIEREVTLTDEEFYTQPIVLRLPMSFAPDTDMLEYVCAENPRSRPHLVGRTEQERKVVVAPDLLRRYVGTYRAAGPVLLGITEFTVFFENDQLFIRLNGKGRVPLTPLSTTTFSPRFLGTMEFVVAADGSVSRVISHAAEGGVRYERDGVTQ